MKIINLYLIISQEDEEDKEKYIGSFNSEEKLEQLGFTKTVSYINGRWWTYNGHFFRTEETEINKLLVDLNEI